VYDELSTAKYTFWMSLRITVWYESIAATTQSTVVTDGLRTGHVTDLKTFLAPNH